MLAPSSSLARCRQSGSRAVRITSAPSSRASRAVSRPMPELPPITTTVCPASSGLPLMLSPLGRSPLLVRVEDVVLRLHGHMADVSAVGFGLVGRHLAGRDVMVEERVSPAAAVRKSLAVLFDEEGLRG